jgi:hypothetical protein
MAIRCRAENPLTCRVHGITLDFTEVPDYIRPRFEKLVKLEQAKEDAQGDLYEYTLLSGLSPTDVGFMSYHDPAGNVPLRKFYHAYMEAELREREALDAQYEQTAELVYELLEESFPDKDADEIYALHKLSGLRFFGVEKEWGEDADEGYQENFDLTTQQLFGQLSDPQVRDKLKRVDRAFFAALTGVIPDDEDLNSLAYERLIRYKGSPTPEDTDRAEELVTRLLSKEPTA